MTSSTTRGAASARDAEEKVRGRGRQPARPRTRRRSHRNASFHIARAFSFRFGALTYRASDVKPAEAPLIGLKAGLKPETSPWVMWTVFIVAFVAEMMVLAEVVFTEGDNQESETDVERMLLQV